MKKKILLILLFLIYLLPSQILADNHQSLIIIKKATNQLAYYENGKMIKTFPIAINDPQTPVGVYSIVLKKENPSYLPERIPGGDPKNPYGSLWLGFNYGQTSGKVYGIHGTNNPSIIGSYSTKGSISLRNEDIRWLYTRVSEGTPVAITNSTSSFDTIYATVLGTPVANNPSTVSLYINDQKQNPPQAPVIVNDSTFVPLRYIFEKIGATVEWNETDRTIIATRGDKKLQLAIGSKVARYNGINQEINTAPFIKDSITYVPLRSVFEYFGAEVNWDPEKRAVFITTKDILPIIFYINDAIQDKTLLEQSKIIYDATDTKIEEILIPAPFIFEKFGANAQFIADENKLIITRNEKIVELIIGSKQMKINGYRELLDHAPELKNGTVLIPTKLVERLFGAFVTIDNFKTERTVSIDYELTDLATFYFNGNMRLPYTGFIVNDVHYIPLSVVFMELDVEFTVDGLKNEEESIIGRDSAENNSKNTGEIEIIKGGTLIQMHLDSHSAFVNGKLVSIPHPPKRMDGFIILPLQFIADTLGVTVHQETNKEVYIYQ